MGVGFKARASHPRHNQTQTRVPPPGNLQAFAWSLINKQQQNNNDNNTYTTMIPAHTSNFLLKQKGNS